MTQTLLEKWGRSREVGLKSGLVLPPVTRQIPSSPVIDISLFLEPLRVIDWCELVAIWRKLSPTCLHHLEQGEAVLSLWVWKGFETGFVPDLEKRHDGLCRPAHGILNKGRLFRVVLFQVCLQNLQQPRGEQYLSSLCIWPRNRPSGMDKSWGKSCTIVKNQNISSVQQWSHI